MTQHGSALKGHGRNRWHCRQLCLAALLAAAVPDGSGAALAQTEGTGAKPGSDKNVGTQMVPSLATIIAKMPKNLPRAKGPGLREAIDAAAAAEQVCRAKGAKVSVLVADSVGQPVVLLSGDGAGVRSQLIARTKVNIVAKFGKPSGDVAETAKTHADLTAAAATDPDIGMLRGGGFPVVRDGELIAIVGVSGGSLTGPLGLDEACAKVAVDQLEQGQGSHGQH